MKKIYPKQSRKGFTLIELLVVIAIIAILATVVIINVTGARAKAVEARVSNNISEANKAVGMCNANGVGTVSSPLADSLVCANDSMVTTIWPDLSGTGFSYDLCSSPITNSAYSCTATNSTTNRKITFTNTGTQPITDIIVSSDPSAVTFVSQTPSGGTPTGQRNYFDYANSYTLTANYSANITSCTASVVPVGGAVPLSSAPCSVTGSTATATLPGSNGTNSLKGSYDVTINSIESGLTVAPVLFYIMID